MVQELVDREAIRQLLYRYCRAVDRIDPDLGYSIWHDDAIADYGADYYQGPARGLIDLICENHRRVIGHSHQITNITLEIDGDQAATEAYHVAALRATVGGQLKQFTIWGRYLDRWSRRNGRWGIDKRTMIRDLDKVSDVTALSVTRGSRDRNDPSYAILGEVER
jgi:hypothetical protein